MTIFRNFGLTVAASLLVAAVGHRCQRAARATLLIVIAAAFAPIRVLQAQAGRPSQYDVQAAYLYNFAKFVRWPAEAVNGPVQLCVAGPNSFADTLRSVVKGEVIDSRQVVVRSVEKPDQAAGCSLLFIDASAKPHSETLLASVAGKPTVTVSDAPDFLDHGGMIQFLLVANRVRFAVSLTPATRSGLSLSSELLRVAVSVNGRAGGGL